MWLRIVECHWASVQPTTCLLAIYVWFEMGKLSNAWLHVRDGTSQHRMEKAWMSSRAMANYCAVQRHPWQRNNVAQAQWLRPPMWNWSTAIAPPHTAMPTMTKVGYTIARIQPISWSISANSGDICPRPVHIILCIFKIYFHSEESGISEFLKNN